MNSAEFNGRFRFRKQPPELFYKKGVLRNFAKFTGKHLEACKFIKKETPAQVFSCQFFEIFKNTFFTNFLSGISDCNWTRTHNRLVRVQFG